MNLIGERKERIMHGKKAEKEGRKWWQMSLEIQVLVSDSMFKKFQIQICIFFFFLLLVNIVVQWFLADSSEGCGFDPPA